MSQVGIQAMGRLPVHDHLTVNSGGLISEGSLKLEIGCKAYLSAVQNIPHDTLTKVLFNAEEYDIGGDFSADGVNSEFIVPVPRYYLLYLQVAAKSLGIDKEFNLFFYKDGAELVASFGQTAFATNKSKILLTADYLNASEVIDARIVQKSGGAIEIWDLAIRTYICIHAIGR